MKRKILKKLSLLSLLSIPLVFISCNNNNNNQVLQNDTNIIPSEDTTTSNTNTIEYYEPTIDGMIEGINNDKSEFLPLFDGFSSFKKIEDNPYIVHGYRYKNPVGEKLYVDLYYGITTFYSGGRYNGVGDSFGDSGHEYPMFYSTFISEFTTEIKRKEYIENKTPLIEWETNKCDFEQEVELNIYRSIYDGGGIIGTGTPERTAEAKSKKKIYSYKNSLGYFLSSDFEFNKNQYVRDVISKEEFITDEYGNGIIMYDFEIVPVNEDCIKLQVQLDKDITRLDYDHPYYVIDEYGDEKKCYPEIIINHKGELVNPYMSIGNKTVKFDRIYFTRSSLIYEKEPNDEIILLNYTFDSYYRNYESYYYDLYPVYQNTMLIKNNEGKKQFLVREGFDLKSAIKYIKVYKYWQSIKFDIDQNDNIICSCYNKETDSWYEIELKYLSNEEYIKKVIWALLW